MQVQTIPPIGAKWHLLAFNSTNAATAGYQQANAVPDPVFSRSANAYQNPYNLGAFGAYAQSTNILRARLNTASLRLRGFPIIRPVVSGTQPPTDANWCDFVNFPMYLRPDEDIQMDIDSGANADITTGFLWVYYAGGESPPIVNANINALDLRWIRATVTYTSTLNTWSGPQTITLDDNIEGGSYDVYGAECFGTNVQAFRLWFQNQYWKPGTLGYAAVGSRLPYPWYTGRFGLWGNFNTYSLPQLETFESAAASTLKTLNLLIGKSSQQFRGMSN